MSSHPSAKGGIGIMVRSNSLKNVIEIRRINAWMMVVVTTIENEMIFNISVYAPQCGCSTEEKDLLYDNLSVEMIKIHKKCVLLGNFNGHVVKDSDEYVCTEGLGMVKKMLMEAKCWSLLIVLN